MIAIEEWSEKVGMRGGACIVIRDAINGINRINNMHCYLAASLLRTRVGMDRPKGGKGVSFPSPAVYIALHS